MTDSPNEQYLPDDVFAIPTGWKSVRVSELCNLRRGFDITESTRTPGSVPVFSSSGISYYHNEYKVRPPGVVTGRKGILGNVFLVGEPFWPHDTTLWADNFNGNDPAFVALLLSEFHLERLDAATSVPTLNRNNLTGYFVNIPETLAEQQAIAEALGDADAWIESLEGLIAKKRHLKQAAMQQLLTGKTRLPGFEGEWETTRLGNLGVFLKGSGVRKDESQSGTLACIRYGEIYTRHQDYVREFYSWISRDVAESATRLRNGDILFAGSGETREEIGKCVAFAQDTEAYAGGDIVILRTHSSDPIFLGYRLNTADVNRQKASKGQGDAVVHIGSNALASVTIRMPSIDEQTAIAQVVIDMDNEIAALKAKLAKARDIKQGMMQQLLTGKIRLV